MSYGNWKHILSVFKLWKQSYDSIFVNTHTTFKIPTATFDFYFFFETKPRSELSLDAKRVGFRKFEYFKWWVMKIKWEVMKKKWFLCFHHHNFVSITHNSKIVRPMERNLVWMCFHVLFPSLNSLILSDELWKLETSFRCVQIMKTELWW